jgi:erythromycin esterase-like protein
MHAIRSAVLMLLLLLAVAAAFASTGPVARAPALSSARELALAAIGERRLVFVGEMHGTQETPALVAEILDAYAARRQPVVLALEISTQEQSRLDRYVASRGTAADRVALLRGPHWRAPHDGRDSDAMVALIDHVRRLRAHGAPIAIVAFDRGGTDMDARNRGMAAALRATATQYPTATLLVLTGNVHAMTHRPSWAMFEDGKRIEPPMSAGRYLADLMPLSIDVEGARGGYWSCTAQGCHVQTIAGPASRQRPTLQRNGRDNAWDVTLVLPRFTPSAPAIRPARGAVAPPARAVNP